MFNRHVCFILIFISVLFAKDVMSQDVSDDEPEYWLDEIVVISERTQNLLRESITATSVLTASTLEQLPARNLAEALKYVPGLTFVQKDGSGNDPIAIIRGFYGGGETEYILLTVDGVPVNDLRTGLVEWGQIPLNDIERIEVLRGGGSALYGDTALGAVINVVTHRTEAVKSVFINSFIGEEKSRGSNLGYKNRFGKHDLKISADIKSIGGFRSHAKWDNLLFSGQYMYELKPENRIRLRWNAQRVDRKDPGPLTLQQIAQNRKQSNPIFHYDNRRRDNIEISIGFINSAEQSKSFSVDLGVRRINQEQIRTLLLLPGWGDTQFHDESHSSLWTRMQYNFELLSSSMVTGLDAEYGDYDSRYFTLLDRRTALSEGFGKRYKAGLYLEFNKKFMQRWRATGALRYDWINDNFESGQNNSSAGSFKQWTPRLGLNFSYITAKAFSGHIYTNWTKSFKAPTLDQLFDQRQIPAGVEDTFITFANDLLQPQKATGYEIGIYQRFYFIENLFTGELTTSAYRMNLKNEIDFDLSTFQYGNIQNSRHDGVEFSTSFYILPLISFTHTLNYMDVTFRSGQSYKKKLKNIPEVSYNNTVSIYPIQNIPVTFTHSYFGDVYLDDGNLTRLSGYHTVDAKVQFDLKSFEIYILGKNLLDKQYNSSGYVLFDPFTLNNVQFLYPAQGRYLQAGVRVAF